MITIVSGLPRSGTSLMMQMLEAGGLPPLTDRIRKSDEDNPRGYYEFERVKKIKDDSAWLDDCCGKAVKMVSMLLFDLPADREYRIIFMERDMSEILASQKAMLKRLGENDDGIGDEEGGDSNDGIADDKMAAMFEKHLSRVKTWLAGQGHIRVIYINHHETVTGPEIVAEKVNEFIGGRLDEARMTGVVDSKLYRQRAGRD